MASPTANYCVQHCWAALHNHHGGIDNNEKQQQQHCPPVEFDSQVLHQLHIALVAVVVVVGHIGILVVGGIAWGLRVGVPNALALAILIPSALNLFKKRPKFAIFMLVLCFMPFVCKRSGLEAVENSRQLCTSTPKLAQILLSTLGDNKGNIRTP